MAARYTWSRLRFFAVCTHRLHRTLRVHICCTHVAHPCCCARGLAAHLLGSFASRPHPRWRFAPPPPRARTATTAHSRTSLQLGMPGMAVSILPLQQLFYTHFRTRQITVASATAASGTPPRGSISVHYRQMGFFIIPSSWPCYATRRYRAALHMPLRPAAFTTFPKLHICDSVSSWRNLGRRLHKQDQYPDLPQMLSLYRCL